MEQLSHRDMIDLFLDGQLPAEMRSVFFAALAASEEFQADFHRATVIHAAAHRHAQTLQPPPALTASILAAATPQVPASRTRSGWFHTKALRTIALTAVATVIGFFIGRLSGPLPSITKLAMQSEHAAAGNAVAGQYTTRQAIPTSQNTPTAHTTTAQPKSTSPVALRTPSANEDTAPIPSDVLTAVAVMPLPTPALPVDSSPASLQPLPPPVGHTLEQYSAPLPLPPAVEEPEEEFILSIRQTTPLVLRQQRLLSPLSSSPLNNTMIAAEYRERTVSILAQCGYEQFPIYEVTAAADGTPQYTLRQLLWWVGGGMRVYAPRAEEGLFRTLRPMAGIVLGTSQYGVLGRGELGLSWEVLPHLSVQCLLEGMVHSHGIGTNWEHAEKLSASIGLAFRF